MLTLEDNDDDDDDDDDGDRESWRILVPAIVCAMFDTRG